MSSISRVLIQDLYGKASQIQELAMPYLELSQYDGLEFARTKDPLVGISVIDTVVERILVRHASVRRRYMERKGRTPIDELSSEYLGWRDDISKSSIDGWDTALGALMRPEKRGGIAIINVRGYTPDQLTHWDQQPNICNEMKERFGIDPNRRTVSLVGFTNQNEAAFSAYSPEFLDLVDQIIEMLEPLLAEITKFLGDHYWTMFTRRWQGTDLYVEHGMDYRVYDWHRRMGTGEWDY